MNPNLLSVEQILDVSHQPRLPELVTIEGYGAVHVPRFTAGELTAFYSSLENVPDDQQAGVELTRILVDVRGQKLFREDQAYELGQLPAAFVVPIRRRFRAVNGLDSGN